MGKFDMAMGDLAKAQNADPTSPLPYAVRARAFFLSEDLERAAFEAEKALQMDANCPDALLMRGVANLYASPETREATIQDLNRTIEIDSTSALAHLFHAIYWHAKNEPRKARRDAEAARERLPSTPDGFSALPQNSWVSRNWFPGAQVRFFRHRRTKNGEESGIQKIGPDATARARREFSRSDLAIRRLGYRTAEPSSARLGRNKVADRRASINRLHRLNHFLPCNALKTHLVLKVAVSGDPQILPRSLEKLAAVYEQLGEIDMAIRWQRAAVESAPTKLKDKYETELTRLERLSQFPVSPCD